MSRHPRQAGVVARYLDLGLALGRHIDGLVDAYYGPPDVAARVAAEPVRPPARLVDQARALLAAVDGGEELDDGERSDPSDAADGRRRRWIRAQIVGLHTTARRLAGETVTYADEVEWCYGVRPHPVPDDVIAAAHRSLDEVLPGSGPVHDRYVTWRETQVVPVDVLPRCVASLAEDLRERTEHLFGLPDGEHVDFDLVSGQPWSGFNHYLGGLRSKVEINTDLPVPSTTVGHLVAHEAYPGHHTEHCRKEASLVRGRHRLEETIFLVGTPQCLLAEGLADLGLEVVMGRRPEPALAPHLRRLGVPYDEELVAQVAEAGEALAGVRANAAWRLHADGADPDTVVDELAAWGLLPRARAEKHVEFLLHPTWRAYISCYVEGLPLCRAFVAGDPTRFRRLVSEQLVPDDLRAA